MEEKRRKDGGREKSFSPFQGELRLRKRRKIMIKKD